MTDSQLLRKDEDGRTLLHSAAGEGKAELVEHVLQSGGTAVLNAADDEVLSVDWPHCPWPDVLPQGWTPLMSASSAGHVAVVSMLLGAGADARAANTGGRTCAHYAASKGHAAVLSLLLDGGASVDTADCTGSTPLHSGAATNQVPCVKLLLAAGAALELKTKQGETPLLVAAHAQADRAVVTLAGAGAELAAADAEGNTVAMLRPLLRNVLDSVAAGEDAGWDME
jgi:ankyrin repeat protein